MSRLQIFDESDGRLIEETTDGQAISRALHQIGVTFERWPLRPMESVNLAGSPALDSQESVPFETVNFAPPDPLDVYAEEVERLRAMGGYRSIDVARVTPDHPERDAMRGKFLSEHTHGEDEVRFFVEGEGLFTLHAEGRVWNMLCCAGDLISVPAGMPHWFDMGAAPSFTAIRMFVNPDGWIAQFTGDTIADRFPRHKA